MAEEQSVSNVIAKTVDPLFSKTPYPEWAKMPEGYDFDTKGKDWSEFHNDFLLRTDAVWEKNKLKEFFRLYYKCMYFDPRSEEYVILEPEDQYTLLHEGHNLEDYFTTYFGMNPTGRTNSFQVAMAPRDRVKVSAQNCLVHVDFFELFEKWHNCDTDHGYDRTKMDRNPKNINDPEKAYPCFREFHEASYACNDDLFDFLLELHYIRQVNQFDFRRVSNVEIKRIPTIYDSSQQNDRRTYTY